MDSALNYRTGYDRQDGGLFMNEDKFSDKRLLTRADVAEIFQVSPSTITRWADRGILPAVKTLGGHRRYEATVVQELIQQLSETEEATMEKIVFETPAMYGDHHVMEVRRLLLALPGVDIVNASSCFHAVEIDYDPAVITSGKLKIVLEEAGYLGDLIVPTESGIAVTQRAKQDSTQFFRHTAAFAQTGNVVSFGQQVNYDGRPLWPCPGMGVIKLSEFEEVDRG
jgi:excisionase family DNA binding protein